MTTPDDTTPDHVRHIFRWDLDKTYLSTDFDSVRDLIRTALQKPEEKVNVPGADALLRQLTRPNDKGRVVLTFISGSPEQMRRTIELKFALDGVRPDTFILKPQLEYLLRGKIRAIRGQVGYKLDALLRVRALAPLAEEALFGDDAEQDAFIYSLYADTVSQAITPDTLRALLDQARVYPDTRDLIVERAKTARKQDTVRRIFINLDRQSSPGRFLPFGPRVIPINNYFQAALVLFEDDVLSPEGLLRVAFDMVTDTLYGVAELANAFHDLGRRGILDRTTVERFESHQSELLHIEEIPEDFTRRLISRLLALAPLNLLQARAWDGPPDYKGILRTDEGLREAVEEEPRKKRSFFGRRKR